MKRCERATPQQPSLRDTNAIQPLLEPSLSGIHSILEKDTPDHVMLGPGGAVNLRRFFVTYPKDPVSMANCCFINEWNGKSGGPHDHPFDFVALVVEGVKQEVVYTHRGLAVTSHEYPPGTLMFTRYDQIHLVHAHPRLITLVHTGEVRQHCSYVYENGRRHSIFEYRQKRNSFHVGG